MKLKKYTALVLVAVLLICGLSACSSKPENPSEKKLSIVCSTFPQYDWVRCILGEKASDSELSLLLDKGVDLHNYQPSVEDIAAISACDVFIYNGGESDKWVQDILKNLDVTKKTVINLLSALGENARTEETLAGMQDEHEHEHEDGEEHEGEEEKEYDEHIWLSLKNAGILCTYIAESLAVKDSENAQIYRTNAADYVSKLNELDKQYKSAADSGKYKALVFADRFPFRYLADDYGIECFAAFSGCSAETEASFETVIFLAGKVDELGLDSVVAIEGSDLSVAKTVVNATSKKNQQILVLDSLQSVTASDVQGGKSYLLVMEKNLSIFKQALKAGE